MNFLQSFITKYHETFCIQSFDESFLGKIKEFAFALNQDHLHPSSELRSALNTLQVRASEPMKVAITGQFSSGKSTFLNALLGKSILPTGITPVTSKVNFIQYADEFKIKVTYHDKKEEFYDIKSISRFTDQRQNVEDIAFLSVYAPLDLLKEITFVDTPGLNSQAKSDTQTTQNLLKEVDAIIWLSLIDNAGKLSELEVLEEYLSSYSDKSLCVLNQKDKFTDEQIKQTLTHVKNNFSHFFAEVIAISALKAFRAKSVNKDIKIENLKEKFIENFKNKNISQLSDQATLLEEMKEFDLQIKSILNEQTEQTKEDYINSNMPLVLDFIEKRIRPKANQSKQFAIKKTANNMLKILQNEHEKYIQIYSQLENIISDFEIFAKQSFMQLEEKFAGKLSLAYSKIEQMIDKIAQEILNHLKKEERTRYQAIKPGFFQKEQLYKAINYEVNKIDSDQINNKLFFDDNLVGKMFVKYVKDLHLILEEVNQANDNIYDHLEKEILHWQMPYELLQKTQSLQSSENHANLRKFASKAYENFLKSYNKSISIARANISSKFNHLSSAVNFNYQNATQITIASLEKHIESSIKMYEISQFSIYSPNIDDVKDKLKKAFHLYELDNLLHSKETFLHVEYARLLNDFSQISQEKKNLLQKRKEKNEKIIQELETFMIK